METRPYVSWELMNAFLTDAFAGYGVPRDEAAICADVLLESDRRGIESHGCNRFKPIYIDRIEAGIQNPVTKIDILKETPTTAVLDANDGMGMVASHRAMEMAIEKAKNFGLAMVAVRNSTHYGIAGYWTTMATDAGMIGMTGTNARPVTDELDVLAGATGAFAAVGHDVGAVGGVVEGLDVDGQIFVY